MQNAVTEEQQKALQSSDLQFFKLQGPTWRVPGKRFPGAAAKPGTNFVNFFLMVALTTLISEKFECS